MRGKTRLKYPGACSLEFQSIMQVLIDKLFNWDIKTQKARGPGIFGTVLAFAPADEEQGRKTLHRHIQVWVKEFDHHLRRDLFHKDENLKREARSKFQQYIDRIMSTSFGLDISKVEVKSNGDDNENYSYNNGNNEEYPKKFFSFTDRPFQDFRDARHKHLCNDIKGKVIQNDSNKGFTDTKALLQCSLQQQRKNALRDCSLDGKKIDLLAYTYPYHMKHGPNCIHDDFWGNENIRKAYLHWKFNIHDFKHRPSCFKKTCECRFNFPFPTCSETYIHEDPGPNNENVVLWYDLDLGTPRKMPPWMVIPKRPMGCQYMNVYSSLLSEIFACNTNVQVGDPFHTYYTTLYNIKSTQEEDGERNQRTIQTILRRLIRIQDEIRSGIRDKNDEDESDLVEGRCRMLSGMHAATSRYVVSSTMAHLLICQNGTRFKFSHDFSDLLVGQLEAALHGEEVDFRIRVNRHKKEKIAWKDSLKDDYFHRPNGPKYGKIFEDMCSYEMAMKYKKNI